MANHHIIKNTVERLVRRHETTDPFRLCKYMGLYVLYASIAYINGVYTQRRRIRFVCINEDLDETMQRIACAHELGHIMMKHEENTVFLTTKTLFSMDKFEIEANTFAAELLITDDDLEEYHLMGCSEDSIAYQTGLPAEIVRLKRT